MVSPDSKRMIVNLDRISQLPESMIVDILSHLPLKDSIRASILSKAWKSFCSLHPILYFDHNLFALQSLVSAKEGGGGPDINQMRDMFMDGVDYRLSGAKQLGYPIRKLSLTVAINDSMHFYRVDKWMELVKQIRVEDLCITVQSVDYMCADNIHSTSVVYEFPLSVLISRGLRKAYVRGCKLGCETLIGDPINNFFSLQRLSLRHVFMDQNVLENLIRCCQGIETLVLSSCYAEIICLKLSKFPKLKKAVIRLHASIFAIVDIQDTNLECFKCYAGTEVHVRQVAYAGIRELTLGSRTIIQPDVLKDLTATFPLLEEGNFSLRGADTLKAASNVLKKLTVSTYPSYPPVCMVHIDCPSLTSLNFFTNAISELNVDCPNLRVFSYHGNTVPGRVFCRPMANLEESRCDITVYDAYDTLWLVNLRAFLVLTVGTATDVKLTLKLPMATFEPEQVEAIEVSPRYNVHLTLVLDFDIMQDIAALMDGLLWIIRPTTLTVSCETNYVVKYLCENLLKKQDDNICDEQLTLLPCWMHKLEDFHVECPLGVPVPKKNLAAFPEHCRTLIAEQVHFKFHWCFN